MTNKATSLLKLFHPFVLFIIAGAIALSIYDKDSIFFFINGHHNSISDIIFYYMTTLGNGWMYAVVLVYVLLFKSPKHALALLGVAFVQTLITSTCKEWLFSDIKRPAAWFENSLQLVHFVDGVKIHYAHSFPSGHTATAFGIYAFLLLFYPKKTIAYFGFLLALGVAWSRVYLAQHFFADVFAGSIAGVVSGLIIYLITFFKSDAGPTWLNKPLLSTPLKQEVQA